MKQTLVFSFFVLGMASGCGPSGSQPGIPNSASGSLTGDRLDADKAQLPRTSAEPPVPGGVPASPSEVPPLETRAGLSQLLAFNGLGFSRQWEGFKNLTPVGIEEFAMVTESTLTGDREDRYRWVCASIIKHTNPDYPLPILIPGEAVKQTLCGSPEVYHFLWKASADPDNEKEKSTQKADEKRASAALPCHAYRLQKTYRRDWAERLITRMDFMADPGEPLDQSQCRLDSRFGLGLDGSCYRMGLYRVQTSDRESRWTESIQSLWIPEETVPFEKCKGKSKP